MSDCLRCPVCSCAHFLCTLHTRPRVQRASGIPCALCFQRGKFPEKLARNARRDGEVMCSVIASEAKQSISPHEGRMDCFASLAMTADNQVHGPQSHSER